MNKEIRIAPLKKSIIVRASRERAFDVFTTRMGSWWPKTHHMGVSPLVDIAIEPMVDGRWLTHHEDGTEIVISRVRAWEPPLRFVASWEIDAQWGRDVVAASEVEVRFVAEAPDRTRVEVEHRNFERLGREGGEKMRRDVGNGWPVVLDRFGGAIGTG